MRKCLLSFLMITLTVGIMAASNTKVTLYLVNPDLVTYPARATGYATVTQTSFNNPAVIGKQIRGTYDSSTGELVWILPQNSEVHFQVSSAWTGLDDTYSLGTASAYTLNDLVPITPASAPGWAGLLAPFLGSDSLSIGDVPTWNGTMWSMQGGSSKNINLTQTAEPDLSGMTATPNAAGILTGNYYYSVTYVTADGETGIDESDYIGPVNPSNQSVDLAGIPTGPSGVIARKLYRTQDISDIKKYKLQYLATLSNNTTTTYTDNIADSALGDPPPRQNTTGGNIYLDGTKIGYADDYSVSLGESAAPYAGMGTVAIGPLSGPQTPTWDHDSVYVGYAAGESEPWDAAGETLIGTGAGQLHAAGHRNTMIGLNAGYGHTSGEGNTFIGAFCTNSSQTFTSDYATVLGYNMGVIPQSGHFYLGSNQSVWAEGTPGGTVSLFGNHVITGTLQVTGNVTAPNIGPPPDLSGYARMDTAQDFTARQEFTGGFAVDGQAASDVEPESVTISGQAAYPGASTYQTGGNLYLSGGAGDQQIIITDYTALVDADIYLTINRWLPNEREYTLSEGVQWAASTDNATTAANLRGAIMAWCPGIYASVSGAIIQLTRASSASSIYVDSYQSAGWTIANGIAGATYLVGKTNSTGSFSLYGRESIYPHAWSPLPGETKINISNKTLIIVSGAASWLWTNGFYDGDGIDTGRIVVLLNTDGGLTIPASMVGNLNSNYTMAAGESVTMMYDGTTWQILGKPTGGSSGEIQYNDAGMLKGVTGSSVDGSGNVTFPANITTVGNGAIGYSLNIGGNKWRTASNYQSMSSDMLLTWGSSASTYLPKVLSLSRASDGVLQVGDGAANSNGAFKAGDVSIGGSGALPTASATYRGRIWVVQGASGVADQAYVCMKKSDDTYAWQQITSTP